MPWSVRRDRHLSRLVTGAREILLRRSRRNRLHTNGSEGQPAFSRRLGETMPIWTSYLHAAGG